MTDDAARTGKALEAARSAHALALAAATQRALNAWNENIREQFLDDAPTVIAFIDLLGKYERLVDEAAAAGVPGVLKVAETFHTSAEVSNRHDYAKRALGLE